MYVGLLAVFAGSVWGTYRAAFPARGLSRVDGVFQARATDTIVLLRHEAVPGLMPEMPAMAFVAESPDVLDRARLTPGDRVSLTVRLGPDTHVIVKIRRIR